MLEVAGAVITVVGSVFGCYLAVRLGINTLSVEVRLLSVQVNGIRDGERKLDGTMLSQLAEHDRRLTVLEGRPVIHCPHSPLA